VSNGNATKCKLHQINALDALPGLSLRAAENTGVNVAACPWLASPLSTDKLQPSPICLSGEVFGEEHIGGGRALARVRAQKN
jgi:hypothetical protein